MASRAEKILVLAEKGHYNVKQLLKNRTKLDPEERAEVMKRKAVWHFNGGGPSSAIWKSTDASGNTVYGCHTHRCMQVRPTLKGAIKAFDFVKTTA